MLTVTVTATGIGSGTMILTLSVTVIQESGTSTLTGLEFLSCTLDRWSLGNAGEEVARCGITS